jgi:hypothetical protein
MKLLNYKNEGQCIFVKVVINNDNNQTEDFGPFSLEMLKQLFLDSRIDGRSYIYAPDLDNWKILADFPDFKQVFGEEPPEVTSYHRRLNTRATLNCKCMVFAEKNRYISNASDLSMMAVKLAFHGHDLILDQEVFLEFELPELKGEKILSQVMRLFDSTGEEQFVTFRFKELSEQQRNKISSVVHAGITKSR